MLRDADAETAQAVPTIQLSTEPATLDMQELQTKLLAGHEEIKEIYKKLAATEKGRAAAERDRADSERRVSDCRTEVIRLTKENAGLRRAQYAMIAKRANLKREENEGEEVRRVLTGSLLDKVSETTNINSSA